MGLSHLSRLFLLSTFLLNILHVYQISDEYLKYDVTTDVQLIFPDILEKPTVTICFKLYRVVKWDSLKPEDWKTLSLNKNLELSIQNWTRDPESFETFSFKEKKITEPLNKHYNVQEIINMTLSLEEILESAFVIRPEDLDGKLLRRIWLPRYREAPGHEEAVLEVRTFLMNQEKCFSLRFVTSKRFVNFKKIHRSLHDGLLEELLMKPNPFLKEVRVFVSDNQNQLTHGSYSSETISLSEGWKSTGMSYDTYKSSLLEHPYSTNCFEYPDHMTSDKCHHKCFKREAIEKVRIIPLACNAYENETFKRVPDKRTGVLENGLLWSYNEFLMDTEKFCNKKCDRRECHSVIHVPRLESHASTDGEANNAIIVLRSSKTPVINTVSQPAINLVTYLTNVFSTFGFWMGVSVLGAMKSLQQQTEGEHSFWQILKERASSLGFKRFTDIPRRRRQYRVKLFVRSVRKVLPEGNQGYNRKVTTANWSPHYEKTAHSRQVKEEGHVLLS